MLSCLFPPCFSPLSLLHVCCHLAISVCDHQNLLLNHRSCQCQPYSPKILSLCALPGFPSDSTHPHHLSAKEEIGQVAFSPNVVGIVFSTNTLKSREAIQPSGVSRSTPPPRRGVSYYTEVYSGYVYGLVRTHFNETTEVGSEFHRTGWERPPSTKGPSPFFSPSLSLHHQLVVFCYPSSRISRQGEPVECKLNSKPTMSLNDLFFFFFLFKYALLQGDR